MTETQARRNPSLPAFTSGLARALRRAVAGEVRFTPGDRALHAYDASIFRQESIGVVIPRHDQDVESALAVCRRYEAPVLAWLPDTSQPGR